MRERLNDDVYVRERLNDDVYVRERLNDDVFRISIDYILELLARFARSPITTVWTEVASPGIFVVKLQPSKIDNR